MSWQKDGLLLKDNRGGLKSEENAEKWQSSRFLQTDAFVGPQGPGMQARLRFVIKETWDIQNLSTIYPLFKIIYAL